MGMPSQPDGKGGYRDMAYPVTKEFREPVSYTHLDVYKRQAQKYGQNTGKENLVKTQDLGYNRDEVQKNRVPSGLCE